MDSSTLTSHTACAETQDIETVAPCVAVALVILRSNMASLMRAAVRISRRHHA